MKNFKKLFGLMLALSLVLLIPGCSEIEPGEDPDNPIITGGPYTITVENGTIEGVADEAGKYPHNTAIRLVAENRIATNELFASWTLEGEVVSRSTPYSLRALRDGHYIANYIVDPDAPILIDPLEGSAIFVQDTDGTDDGVERLIETMFENGLFFYKTQRYPSGLIAVDDVVLLKHNCQWPQRGGTNTDLIRSVIQAILDHPDGFEGEIIVADNGHRQWSTGPYGGGSLDWAQGNAKDTSQSVLKVIDGFKEEGYKVTGNLWDVFTRDLVEEFDEGNMTDGFVRDNASDGNSWRVSYAKFTTEYGTRISFKNGIFDEVSQTYDKERFKVINMPVLKFHNSAHVTGAIKNYFGTHSQQRADNHGALGSVARQMIVMGLPILHIMDMIYIGTHSGGPTIPYANATEINKVAFSNDPIALDYWAAKYVLMPAYTPIDAANAARTNPDGNTNFGNNLRRNRDVFNDAEIPYTTNESEFRVFENGIEK